MRALASGPLPVGNGTIKRMDLLGKSAAAPPAFSAAQAAANGNTVARRKVLQYFDFIVVSLGLAQAHVQ
jgi:hypothetical protein